MALWDSWVQRMCATIWCHDICNPHDDVDWEFCRGSLIFWYTGVIWRRHQMETFSALLVLCEVREIHRSPVDSPYKGQWRGALVFSLICDRTNGWENNRDAGDLIRHWAHCDIVLIFNHSGAGPEHSKRARLLMARAPSQYKYLLFRVWGPHVEDKTVIRQLYL